MIGRDVQCVPRSSRIRLINCVFAREYKYHEGTVKEQERKKGDPEKHQATKQRNMQ